MAESTGGSELVERLERMLGAIGRLESIIGDLLDYARLEQGTLTYRFTTVTVRVQSEREQVRFTVADEGQGIDEAHHGGRVWVESTPGRGASFHVTLPVAD